MSILFHPIHCLWSHCRENVKTGPLWTESNWFQEFCSTKKPLKIWTDGISLCHCTFLILSDWIFRIQYLNSLKWILDTYHISLHLYRKQSTFLFILHISALKRLKNKSKLSSPISQEQCTKKQHLEIKMGSIFQYNWASVTFMKKHCQSLITIIGHMRMNVVVSVSQHVQTHIWIANWWILTEVLKMRLFNDVRHVRKNIK